MLFLSIISIVLVDKIQLGTIIIYLIIITDTADVIFILIGFITMKEKNTNTIPNVVSTITYTQKLANVIIEITYTIKHVVSLFTSTQIYATVHTNKLYGFKKTFLIKIKYNDNLNSLQPNFHSFSKITHSWFFF